MNLYTIKKTLQWSLLTIFAGILVSAYSLWHHVALNSNSLSSSSFCNVNNYVNCDAVALSPYSELFGFPVAALALVFYGAMTYLAMTMFFLPKEEKDRFDGLRGHFHFLAAFSLIPTLGLAVVAFAVLKLFCLLCFVTYILNIGLYLLARKLNKGNPLRWTASIFPPRRSWAFYFGMCAVFALSYPITKGVIGAKGLDERTLQTVLAKHFSSPARNLATDDFPTIGNPEADIVVVEYSDFQCPFCAKAALVLPPIVQSQGGRVKLVSKQYPLDVSCNTSIQGRGHPHACMAAKAAMCVFQSKGDAAYYSLKKKLYANQTVLDSALIQKLSLESGITKDEYDTCVKSSEIHENIVQQVEEGSAAGVTGTPAVFVNGRKLEYGSIAEVLKETLKVYNRN